MTKVINSYEGQEIVESCNRQCPEIKWHIAETKEYIKFISSGFGTNMHGIMKATLVPKIRIDSNFILEDRIKDYIYFWMKHCQPSFIYLFFILSILIFSYFLLPISLESFILCKWVNNDNGFRCL